MPSTPLESKSMRGQDLYYKFTDMEIQAKDVFYTGKSKGDFTTKKASQEQNKLEKSLQFAVSTKRVQNKAQKRLFILVGKLSFFPFQSA